MNGAFAKTFRSGLQPIEISAALRRELDTKAAVVSRDRILVPNHFVVRLSAMDYTRMTGLGTVLIDDLIRLVQQHATAQHYQFAGSISIVLTEDTTLTPGIVMIDSETEQGPVSWIPVLDIAGKRYPIVQARTVIGRGQEADIKVDDASISRKHVEILWDGSRAEVHDLGSTNGSKLDGQPVATAILEPDSTIDIGRTRIVFRVLAQSASIDQFSDLRIEDGDR